MITDEYVAYSESKPEHFVPMVAVKRPEGVVYREITKEDVVNTEQDSQPIGGWIFRTGQNKSSWVRRYMVLKGPFLYYYHAPQNDKPIGIIPLEGADVTIPPDNGKSFIVQKIPRPNEGFEFEISHATRGSIRLYTPTEQERTQWVSACGNNIELYAHSSSRRFETSNVLLKSHGNTKMIISDIKVNTYANRLQTSATFSSPLRASVYETSGAVDEEEHPPIVIDDEEDDYEDISSVASGSTGRTLTTVELAIKEAKEKDAEMKRQAILEREVLMNEKEMQERVKVQASAYPLMKQN